MLKKFPGFIDVHVHLRDPGATHKEDFYTGSRAAIVGGFTFILDMPNNPVPTVSTERLKEKIALSKKAICDIGFHYGTNGINTDSFAAAGKHPRVFGLKLYCNHTTGEMLIENLNLLEKVFAQWKSEKPILVHAEGTQLAGVIAFAYFYNRRIHVCHPSQGCEVELVRLAKQKRMHISAGVTPHHLFLTDKVVKQMESFTMMKPPLGKQEDQDALWEGLHDGTIDLIETDHAPHTKEEKMSEKPPFGIPGLETALGLLLKAVHEKRLTMKHVVRLLYEAPKKIFHIPDQPKTSIELDPQRPYIIGSDGYATKCAWSPFDGWEAYGKVETVIFKGKKLL